MKTRSNRITKSPQASKPKKSMPTKARKPASAAATVAPTTITSSKDKTTYYFYTTAHPFSQFHPSPFSAPLPSFPTITSTSTAVDDDHYHHDTADPPLPASHTFFCAEQYMMLSKALVFGDRAAAGAILKETSSPLVCKRLGRKVRGFDEETWRACREEVVETGTYYKFTRGSDDGSDQLRRRLLDTGDRELAEASPWDRIWGIGFSEANAEANRARWGTNLLGKALMRVRERLRKEEREAEELKGKGGR